MFTGLVETVGTVGAAVKEPSGMLFTILAPSLSALEVGSSVSVSGVCHTVLESRSGEFSARSMDETLRRTTLGSLAPGSRVNLERSLRMGSEIGGHLVAGHVDGVGRVARLEASPTETRVELELPADLARYAASKGSICVDGVSLTVGEVSGRRASVYLIPHTLAVTVASDYIEGTGVNLEVDLIARYVARLMEYKA